MEALQLFKLSKNFEFFEGIRKGLLENSQVKIQYHWRRFKVSTSVSGVGVFLVGRRGASF